MDKTTTDSPHLKMYTNKTHEEDDVNDDQKDIVSTMNDTKLF